MILWKSLTSSTITREPGWGLDDCYAQKGGRLQNDTINTLLLNCLKCGEVLKLTLTSLSSVYHCHFLIIATNYYDGRCRVNSPLEYNKLWSVKVCTGKYQITNIKYRLIEFVHSKCILLKLILPVQRVTRKHRALIFS